MPNQIIDETPELTPIEAAVIASLSAGKTVSQAARESGIHRSTIYNWLHRNPAFAGLLDQTISNHNSALLDQCAELVDPAFDTVRHLIENEEVPPAVRLRAARLVLEFLMASPQPAGSEEFPEPPLPMAPRLLPPPPVEFPSTAAPCTSRNALCPCGSGLKFKRCCGTGAPPKLFPVHRQAA